MHTKGDTIDRIDIDKLAAVARGVLAVVRNIANGTE